MLYIFTFMNLRFIFILITLRQESLHYTPYDDEHLSSMEATLALLLRLLSF